MSLGYRQRSILFYGSVDPIDPRRTADRMGIRRDQFADILGGLIVRKMMKRAPFGRAETTPLGVRRLLADCGGVR